MSRILDRVENRALSHPQSVHVWTAPRRGGGTLSWRYAFSAVIELAPVVGEIARPVYVATYVAVAILIICVASSGLIHQLSWRLPICQIVRGNPCLFPYSDTEHHDNQNKEGIYRRKHRWDKGRPYKIPGSGISPAPLGEKDDEDPRTNNDHRAKLKIEHETPGGSHVAKECERIHIRTVDNVPVAARKALFRESPKGRMGDVARSSHIRFGSTALHICTTPGPMSPEKPAPRTTGGVMNSNADRDLLSGNGCGASLELTRYQSPLRMGQDCHRDKTNPVSCIGGRDISTWHDNSVAQIASFGEVTSPCPMGRSGVIPRKSSKFPDFAHPVACSRPGRFEGDIPHRLRRIRESPLLPNRSRNYIQENTNSSIGDQGETVSERCMDLMNEVAVEFNEIPEECRMAMETAQYLVTLEEFT